MNKAMVVAMAVLAAGAAQGENEAVFFRFVSTTESAAAEMRPEGILVWSNAAASVSGRIQRATDLPASNWTDYVQFAGAGTISTQRLEDWNTPAGMAYIPGGIFQMGNTFDVAEGNPDEVPVHTVFVGEFYMDQTEVTKAQWDETYNWALTNGYAFDNAGSGKATNHPVQTVSWYDCVKWCNARSEREGRTAVYTTNGAIFRTGTNSAVVCDWSAAGYRLPTEAEWEKAARGGALARRFPWEKTNVIDRSRANYVCYRNKGTNFYVYDKALNDGFDPAYANGGMPYTAPVGSFEPNGYGLYDMAGNNTEWCWDWYGSAWYTDAGASVGNSRGPTTGSRRVLRGGSWGSYALYCRVSCRSWGSPEYVYFNYGFRAVLPPSRQ